MKFRGKINNPLNIKQFSRKYTLKINFIMQIFNEKKKMSKLNVSIYLTISFLISLEIVHFIARLSKQCVLKITPNNLYFIVNEIGGINGTSPSLWSEINQSHLFDEFEMDGVSQEHNEINFELIPGKFIIK